MITVQTFTFNPFGENTYILSDATKSCIIIDPGCFNAAEETELLSYIQQNELKVEKIVLTHGHVDHILGLSFCKGQFNVPVYAHKDDDFFIEKLPALCMNYGLPARTAPLPDHYLDDTMLLEFGNSSFGILFTPGHSPGSISFYNRENNLIIAGDVLFSGSIGRSDLPGGDFAILERSIREKLYTLPDQTVVYSGHGPATKIGIEKISNPFVRA